jgi:hypothetical protein
MRNSIAGWVLVIGIIVYSAAMAWGIWRALEMGVGGFSIAGVVGIITILIGYIVMLSWSNNDPELPPDQ